MIVYALVPSIYSTVRTFYRHRISVRVPDRSLAGKTAYCAVACYDPCAVFVDIQVAVSVPAISGIGFIIHNRSGEGAACHIQIQLADAVPDDIALHFLIVRAKEAVRTVYSGLSPASFVVISDAAQEECIVIRVVNIHIGKYKGGFGIGRIKHSAVFCSQCSTVHLKGAVSDLGISGHALIQDHIPGAVILFVIAHVSGQIRVKQVQRIQALDADHL